MADLLSFDDLRATADTLATGFQALLDQLDEQKRIGDELRLRLAEAVEKYNQANTSCNSDSEEISDWRNEITKQIKPSSPHENTQHSTHSNEIIDEAKEAVQRLLTSKMAKAVQIRKCPVTHQTTDQEDFEHDFTTPGRIGDLGCPFAKMTNGSNGFCGPDPIAEEFHGEKASGRSKSSGAANSRCPIRFLDKHSPEEVAQYFENHKHEIPRSHQICVKRYQTNEESIRQLDAKYGNLVSMIQGLGVKHKQYLPTNEKVADEPEGDSTNAVEKWAETLNQNAEAVEEPDRIPHFERPLRDIRVGESPSRPWGISVPVDRSPASSALPSENHHQPSEKPVLTTRAPVPANVAPTTQPELLKKDTRRASVQPQVVFNGPVFFGYSAEQAALFLQNLNVSGTA